MNRRSVGIGVGLGAVVVLTFCVVVLIPDPAVWELAYAVWGLAVYEALHLLLSPQAIRVERQVIYASPHGQRIEIGEAVEIQTRLHRLPWAMLCFVRFRHRLPATLSHFGPTVGDIWLPGRDRVKTLHHRLPPLPRGRYRLDALDWTVLDCLALLPIHGSRLAPLEWVVHPQRFRIVEGPAGERPIATAAHPTAALEVVGVRPHRAGDRFSLIHWPATAHRNRLMAREIPDVLDPLLVIYLDVSLASYPSVELFEWAVSVCASLLWQAVSRRIQVNVHWQGQTMRVIERATSDSGQGLMAVMDMLADVQPTAEGVGEANEFQQSGQPPSAVVLIAPIWHQALTRILRASATAATVDWVVPALAAPAQVGNGGSALHATIPHRWAGNASVRTAVPPSGADQPIQWF